MNGNLKSNLPHRLSIFVFIFLNSFEKKAYINIVPQTFLTLGACCQLKSLMVHLSPADYFRDEAHEGGDNNADHNTDRFRQLHEKLEVGHPLHVHL